MEDFNKDKAQELLNNEETRGLLFETLNENEVGKNYLNQHAENYFESKVKSKIGELHSRYDEDFENATGIKKPEGVKSYEFWSGKLKEFNDKVSQLSPEKLEELQAQNEELKSKIENNESAKHFKELWESTQKTATEEIEILKGKINEFQQKEVKGFVSNEVKSALSGLKFDESIKKPVLETYVKQVTKSLEDNAKVLEDGTVAFYDESGEIIVNKRTMEKAKATEILSKKLAEVLADERQQTGGGQGQGDKKPNPSAKSFANAETQGELVDLIEKSLLANGLTKGSKEFVDESTKLFSEYGKSLPLRKI